VCLSSRWRRRRCRAEEKPCWSIPFASARSAASRYQHSRHDRYGGAGAHRGRRTETSNGGNRGNSRTLHVARCKRALTNRNVVRRFRIDLPVVLKCRGCCAPLGAEIHPGNFNQPACVVAEMSMMTPLPSMASDFQPNWRTKCSTPGVVPHRGLGSANLSFWLP
jgi:hypothetical protein